ncbi:hypothetical protein CPB83DRAFT_778698 [Crepidotus variabilis]|uniref:F-box domain-containing protein n=1 Tax=Crepidotus variabilis TaxID=179855 RepID=A0A9P6BC95_9AGAR|nr:hypothetical protein CPB83DRAFT_778698 [Crepidotus variabilis]
MQALLPALPLELIEFIVEHLANEENLDAVRQCCVANKQLVHACRKHLFGTIKVLQDSNWRKQLELSPDPTSHPIARFQQLLEENPSISSYVRELEILSTEAHDFPDNLAVLQYLTTVQVFTFRFSDGHRITAEWTWSTLPEKAEDSLVEFVRRNPLLSVSLSGIQGLPIKILRAFPPLESLAFLNLYLQENTFALAVQLNLQPGAFDLKELTDLSLNVGFRDNPQVTVRIVYALSLSATSLLIDCVADFRDFTCRRNLLTRLQPTCLATLKKIKLDFEVNYTPIFPPYGGLVDELLAISGVNVLEEIYISTQINIDSGLGMDSELWDQLDTVLSSGFPYFRTLRIDVLVGIFAPPEVAQGTQDDLETLFAGIFQWSKKNLSFTASLEAVSI